ncbi:ABC transporter substrate-binding protein, partial [Pseudomonas sp.]
MTEKKVESQLITGQDSVRIFEGLNRGMSRREALRMLGVAGIMASSVGGLLGGAGSVFAAEADAGPATVGKKGGKIRVAGMSSSTADTLDPAKGALSTDYARQYMFYNGLTRFDSHLVPQLELAEKIDHTDASLWIITLRNGITFHNGKPLTADDVVFSLTRHRDPATGSKVMPLMAQFEEIKATGPLEVQIKLTAPNAELPSILAVSHLLIVPKDTTDFNLGIGTGP